MIEPVTMTRRARGEDKLPLFGGSEMLQEQIFEREKMDFVLREAIVDCQGWEMGGEVEDISPVARYEFNARFNDARRGMSAIRSREKRSLRGRSQIERNNERSRMRGESYSLTVDEWQRILLSFHGSCAYCGEYVRLPNIEHLIPICRGGGTDAQNVVPSCWKCNAAKGRKMPLEWLTGERYDEIKSTLRKANP